MGANILPKPFFIGMTLVLVILAACGSPTTPAEPATTAPTTPAVTTPTNSIPATQPATAAPTAKIVQATQPSNAPTIAIATTQPSNDPTTQPAIPGGITAEGYYYLGSPDATVTLIDYSDFL